MRIYLIGYSYSGKSTMGRQLSRRIGLDLFDTDKAIETKYHTTIPMFFDRYGEKAFRIIEQQILFSTGGMDNVVVATGGGTACSDDNIRFILEHGIAIHLQMSTDDIMERISRAHKSRPLMKDKSPEELRQYINTHLNSRLPFYSQAPITVPALHATVNDLESALRDKGFL